MVPGVILYSGRDIGLAQARRLALEQAGYVVVLCNDTEDFVRKFLDGDFDLVVLCNSLRDAERERLSSLVHRFAPRTPVLRVVSRAEEICGGSEHICTGESETVVARVGCVLAVAGGKPPLRRLAADSRPLRAPSRARG
jgi:hypothetical protein